MNALYQALVTHTRLRPRRHALKYRVAYMLLDLAAMPNLRWLGHNRFNLFSFHECDHGAGVGPLQAWVEEKLREAGMDPDGGRILLLTMPRFLGHAFNPISLFFCHARDGALRAILYEVNNTFGQRHSYLIPVRLDETPIRQNCAKAFYVSPFMDMGLDYAFTVHPPDAAFGLHIAVSDQQGLMLNATMAGRRETLSDAVLLRTALAFPFQGLKVVAAIHWEALFIWVKGIALRPRPAPPSQAVSIVPLAPNVNIVKSKTEITA